MDTKEDSEVLRKYDGEKCANIMLNRLAENQLVVKSQQNDEPDLPFEDKLVILRDMYETSRTKFVFKFGHLLLTEELHMFEDDGNADLKCYLKNLKSLLDKTQIKNRRYNYMKDVLIKDGFFNDNELQQRNPLLYKHYVEKYKIRNNIDEQSFSSFLFEKMDKEWNNFCCDVESKLYEEAEEEEENSDNDLNEELKKCSQLDYIFKIILAFFQNRFV